MKNPALFLLLSAALFAGCRLGHAPKNDGGKVATGARSFNADYQPGIKAAQLNIDGAACVFVLADTTGKLFHAELGDSTRHFSLSQSTEDSVHIVNFKMEQEYSNEKHTDSLGVTMTLNPNPVWDITLVTAASATDFDFSAFKIRNLKVNCTAGAFKAKLKPTVPDTYLDITSSVAGVEISIPKDAACEVETESTLGDTELNGFEKKEEGHYQTPGFASAKNKIHIKTKVSLASFEIKRF
jgi:hypothetical protein